MENKTNKATFFNNHPFVTAFGAVIITFIFCSIIFSGNNNQTPSQTYSFDNYQVRVHATTTPVVPKTTQYIPPPKPKPAVVTPNPTPAQTAPVVQQAPKSWHTVQTYSFNNSQNTAPFTIKGSQWRITWTANASGTYCAQYGCNFALQIYSPIDNSYYDQFLASNITSSKTGVSNFYNSGDYYLKIVLGNIDLLSVNVEDYY